MRRSLSEQREPGGDQKFLTFALLSLSILMFSQVFFGERPKPPAEKPAAELAEGGDGGGDEAGDNQGGDAPLAAKPPGEGPEADEPQGNEPPAIEEGPDAKPQLVSLGSAEVDGPFRLLLTLDNRGAAITRAELSTHEFRDLDDRGGYLGELGLVDAPGGGAKVSIVGAGTPGGAAGLKVDDVIVAASGEGDREPLAKPTASAFGEWLRETEPGDVVELKVTRGEETLTIPVTLTRRPLNIIRPESENVRLHNPEMAEEVVNVPSFLVTLDEAGGLKADAAELVAANKRLTSETWKVVQADQQSVTFRKRIAELGLEFEKHFTLVEVPQSERAAPNFPGYHFEFDLQIRNLLEKSQAVAYQLEGPNGLPIEGWWYANRIGRTMSSWWGPKQSRGAWGMVGIRDVIARYQGSEFIQYNCQTIVEEDTEPMGQGAPLAYIGVDAQYFSVVLMPDKEEFDEGWFDTAEAKLATEELPEKGTLATYNNTTFLATRKAVDLQAAGSEGDALTDDFRVFAGPKRPDLLAQYVPANQPDYSLANTLYYGWFGFVARPMLALLHAFYAVVGNYGVAIIMLTVCVRGAMFPLSRKQAINMAKMQELKPEMDRIIAKYKDDMEKRTKAQQELYRKHNFNPMGGCLLMFIQLPIFIGLYRALAVDLELRQAPLFSESIRFCSNLGSPDMFYDWSWLMPQWFNNGQGMFALGPYFNLLPIVTIMLFLLQQKMFMPPPTNEQAELQQKMMKYMMIFFGIMFFKVPSGLCLYFIASSLWGITERKLLPKTTPPDDQSFSKPSSGPKPKPGGGAKNSPSGGGGGGSTAKRKKKQASGKKRSKR